MKTVNDLLEAKGHDVWSITPQTTVLEGLSKMSEKRIGALLVVEQERLCGIFSERDYARKVVLQGKSSRNTPVSEIMTADVTSVNPSQTIRECMELMTAGRFRHLPVLDQGRLVGVVSIGDIVKAVISEQAQVIEQLESYITGR